MKPQEKKQTTESTEKKIYFFNPLRDILDLVNLGVLRGFKSFVKPSALLKFSVVPCG